MEHARLPAPPDRIFNVNRGFIQFVPDKRFNQFLQNRFLNEESELYNPEHIHLTAASIGFVWTNVSNKMRGRIVAGEAEMPTRYKSLRAGTWTVAMLELQLEKWFGAVPDFKITFNAEEWNERDEPARLALFEHELYHCGQALDAFGIPRFSKKTGRPIFAIRGHDIEEFAGVVRRYGVEATGQDRIDFVAAANEIPEIAPARVAALCGTCL